MTCIECLWVGHDPPCRGKVLYRCFNPDGRLGDPRSGKPLASTYGRVVDRPINEDWNPYAAMVGVPAWCPRLRGEEKTT